MRNGATYLDLDAHEIPMSMRERYEKTLGELRVRLRQQADAQRLGEILLEMNAIDQNT